jgi:hypothetical protein
MKRVFIGFAKEDSKFRDFLVGQARNDSSPFDFIDMSVKEAWDTEWKTNCRTKIKGCDGFIVLLTPNTTSADGVLWEIRCALEENIPVLGIYVHKNQKYLVPTGLRGIVIYWDWINIRDFINRL